MNDKKYYVDLIEKICFKYNLSGSLIEKTYIEGISNNNLTCCYVDGRIKKSKELRRELTSVLNDFLKEYQDTIKPLYS